MTCLLDTHTFLWAITNKKKLSSTALKAIENPDHDIFVSAISFWEISLKSSIGKLQITGFSPVELPEIAKDTGFKLIPLLPNDAASYHNLPVNEQHCDPFDRMLIWQSIRQGLTLISKDKNIVHYSSAGLKLLW